MLVTLDLSTDTNLRFTREMKIPFVPFPQLRLVVPVAEGIERTIVTEVYYAFKSGKITVDLTPEDLDMYHREESKFNDMMDRFRSDPEWTLTDSLESEDC